MPNFTILWSWLCTIWTSNHHRQHVIGLSAVCMALKENSPYSGIPDEDMGFPQGWREYDFWQERLL